MNLHLLKKRACEGDSYPFFYYPSFFSFVHTHLPLLKLSHQFLRPLDGLHTAEARCQGKRREEEKPGNNRRHKRNKGGHKPQKVQEKKKINEKNKTEQHGGQCGRRGGGGTKTKSNPPPFCTCLHVSIWVRVCTHINMCVRERERVHIYSCIPPSIPLFLPIPSSLHHLSSAFSS